MNLFSRCLISSLLVISFNAFAEEKVVSALPVLHSLNQALLKGTDIDPVYLPPKRLPVSRISNWIKHKSRKAIAKQGPVTAFSTVESIWPDYALFPNLRIGNVRVIPVDGAKEITAGGALIRVSESDLKNHAYFWMVPDNLIVMSQIMARDYGRIWPSEADKIRKNQFELQQIIRKFALQMDQLLLEHEIDSACTDEEPLKALARATELPTEPAEDCSLEAISIVTMLPKEQDEKRFWVVNPLNKPLKANIDQWLDQNLKSLETGLVKN
ncbi:hypothetical protein [Neptuniibacter sp.]|uniref:hypothetical protein n=1 Tax=Neptuniibacter sp. TaxID=1962643 RepID=UPI0026219C10|nr:hypothetical protein [Neptuniibacter sp.]MCP4595299.1 hypothetical protein [Neptuniibacter sp.]